MLNVVNIVLKRGGKVSEINQLGHNLDIFIDESSYINYLYQRKAILLQNTIAQELNLPASSITLFTEVGDNKKFDKTLYVDSKELNDLQKEKLQTLKASLKRKFKVDVAGKDISQRSNTILQLDDNNAQNSLKFHKRVQCVQSLLSWYSIAFHQSYFDEIDTQKMIRDNPNLTLENLLELEKAIKDKYFEKINDLSFIQKLKVMFINPFRAKFLNILLGKSAANQRLEDYVLTVEAIRKHYVDNEGYQIQSHFIRSQSAKYQQISPKVHYQLYKAPRNDKTNWGGDEVRPTVFLLNGASTKSQFNRNIKTYLDQKYNVVIFDNPGLGQTGYSNSYRHYNIAQQPLKIQKIIEDLQSKGEQYSNITVIAECFSGFMGLNAVINHNTKPEEEREPRYHRVKIILDRTFSSYTDVVRYGGIANYIGYNFIFSYILMPLRHMIAWVLGLVLKANQLPNFIKEIDPKVLFVQRERIMAITNERCGVLGPSVNNESLYDKADIKYIRTHSKNPNKDPHLASWQELEVAGGNKSLIDKADKFIRQNP